MALRLYNTLTRRKEEFVPIEDGRVRMYACGPTVYDYPHIGNYRAYVFEDLLHRYLRYKGYDVTLVMNVTDVDDKMIKTAHGEKGKLEEITDKYEKAFFSGLETLKILEADAYPRATRTIDEMTALVKRLIEVGAAYETPDGSIFFSIAKFPDYGKLVHIAPEEMRAGERVADDDYGKESARDFALWKAWKEEDGEIYWETEVGKGRPGWHIECSAMAMKHLGEELDIHCGGVDNIFPHHENEIAQSQTATGKKFVNYWVHCAHLIVEGEKMSKSLGNTLLLEDLLKEGTRPEAVRFALLGTHYRGTLDFTEKKQAEAEGAVRRISYFSEEMKWIPEGKTDSSLGGVIERAKRHFEDGLDDDLNISEALAALFDMIREVYVLRDKGKLGRDGAGKALDLLNEFDEVLGLLPPEPEKDIEEIKELIKKREECRKEKNWEEADRIRDELLEKGIEVLDTHDKTVWWVK